MEGLARRRDLLKGGGVAVGMSMLGVPLWSIPVLAQDEVPVPFTDIPDEFGSGALGATRRVLDIPGIDGPLTSRNDLLHDSTL